MIKSNKTLVTDVDFNLIKDDIRSLHYSKDEEEWENGKKEFKKKWSKQSPHIYKYLMKNSVSGKCIIIHQVLLKLIQIWKVLMVILKSFLPRENDYQ